MGDRLQLDYIQTKAVAFVTSESAASCSQLVCDKARLQKLSCTTLAEIVAASFAVPGNVTLQCHNCQKKFPLKDVLAGPVKPVSNVNRACPSCSKAFHFWLPIQQ